MLSRLFPARGRWSGRLVLALLGLLLWSVPPAGSVEARSAPVRLDAGGTRFRLTLSEPAHLETGPTGALVLTAGGFSWTRPAGSITRIESVGPLTLGDLHARRSLQVHAAGSLTVAGSLSAPRELRLTSADLLEVRPGAVLQSSAIDLAGRVVLQSGTIQAVRPEGGRVRIDAESVVQQGAVRANGLLGSGGVISIEAGKVYQDVEPSALDATGGRGGAIRVSASQLGVSGRWDAGGLDGGAITVTGDRLLLAGARLSADGGRLGGTIRLGDRRQPGGGPTSLELSPFSSVTANGERGGRIEVWAAGEATVQGAVEARPGGFVELSAGAGLRYAGFADAGPDGTVLLDPKNVTVDATNGTLPSATVLVGSTANDFEFLNFIPLSTGNVVLVLPRSNLANLDAGAAYLINGQTGATISVLTGSSVNDRIGESGLVALTNGNFVVASWQWDRTGVIDVGAVTWGSGTIGVSGTVTSANSLVGTSANDFVGSGFGVQALTNGNYVVPSPNWANGPITKTGAVTWGNGATGIVGPVSAANSLIGSTANDKVGEFGVTALSNGNYVVSSPSWDRTSAGYVDAGAATWGNGATGITGSISVGNSYVGGATGDRVSSDRVTALTNGNYVVGSSRLSALALAGVGAATWGNGATGSTGTVLPTNGIRGTKDSDFVSNGGVTALANGNYVVRSVSWANGTITNAGAMTWGNGATGTTVPVSAANSLVGTTSGDTGFSTRIIALTNGNYVVTSPFWDRGTIADAGAATWGDGSTGVTGPIAVTNSLVGSTAGDSVGQSAVALTNGNYVVRSSTWDRGAIVDAGAATWGNGSTGITGPVTVTNSLVGSTAGDQVGYIGLTPLVNGNYVVGSMYWNRGGIADAGAATWGNGATGVVGPIDESNSIVGSSLNDLIGQNDVTALTNGNYVLTAFNWDAGRGAVRLGNGATGTTGVLTGTNSLVGTTPGDAVGGFYGVTALANGNYLFSSSGVDNGLITNAGAMTWASGATGAGYAGFGTVGQANSVLGTTMNEDPQPFFVEASGTGTAFGFVGSGSGRLVQLLTDPYAVSYHRFGAASNSLPPSALAFGLGQGTNVTLQANNDLTVNGAVANATSSTALLRLNAGRSLQVNAPLQTGGGNVHLIANDSLANGVVDSQRDPGPAQLSTIGALLHAGTGSVTAELRDGAGKTNAASGQLSLGPVLAGALAVTSTTSIQLSGPVTVSTFALRAPGGIALGSGASLAGSGAIDGPLSMASGATLSPGASPGLVSTTGSLSLGPGATLRIEIEGALPGQYDRLVVGGVVALGGATLAVSGTPPTTAGARLTIIQNDSSEPVAGAFSGLPEGSLLTVGGVTLRIRYTDGDGNDVTLGVVTSPTASTGPASATSSTATFTATVSAGDSPTNVVVEYGTASGVYPLSTPPVTVNGTASQTIAAQVSGLSPATTYFYRVRATNDLGSVVGAEQSVTTSQGSEPPPPLPSPTPPPSGSIATFAPYTGVGVTLEAP